IASDGASSAPSARDMMAAYSARARGGAPPWEPLAAPSVDYAIWPREVLGDDYDPESVGARQIGYWSQALAGQPEAMDLPMARPRPTTRDMRGGAVTATIDPGSHRALVDLARRNGTSPFMVLHGALAVLLSRVSGTEDV